VRASIERKVGYIGDMAMLEVLDERGWRWLGLEIRLEMVRIGDGSVRNTARWPLYIFRTRHGQQK